MSDERAGRPRITVDESDPGTRDGAAAPGGDARGTVPEGAAGGPSEAGSGVGGAGAGGPEPADAERGVGDAVREGGRRVSAWVRRTFPGHEGAFWGAVAGLLAAIVFLVAGPWPLVVTAVFVLVGVAVGQAFDGDPKIVNALRRLFSGNSQ